MPSASIQPAEATPSPSRTSLRALDWLNFFLADVQTGIGPFFAIYLATHQWNEQHVGLALTVGGIAGIGTQLPAGQLADRVHSKRALVAVGVTLLGVGAWLIASFPTFWPELLAQVLVGGVSSIFIPATCAISLGLVGPTLFDRRQGRNQTFNSAGNVTAAVVAGLLGHFVTNQSVFYFVMALTVPTLLSLRFIHPAEIDFERARGAKPDGGPAHTASFRQLLQDARLRTFLACAVMFHFANAAMLPLLGEMLAKGRGRDSMLFMSACVVTTQFVITLLAAWTGRRAGTWGRKPLLLLAFAVLPIRGVLYTLTHDPALRVAIQVLDGVGAGIFGVVSVLVIADLTRGTGRFNVTLGAITMAVGIGASLSQVIAGTVVHRLGYPAGFLFLAAVATVALVLFAKAMPETLERPSE
ncbi:Permease of the major facilitator superfamily [Myxococcus hansupus]|uniref:Permease of the major facilitator superfamily n=1 Tax=Pseudomyxococcus hansupus TaxID=1297742 RepID=A0A0H4WLW8_9BACT|nr:MFS transporter [Myxococcus hansupus]AKQ63749.1 Permease of the major facilitator superfamily [Myxococcus hansupus]